jgi:SAM-dependent methyltransferase
LAVLGPVCYLPASGTMQQQAYEQYAAEAGDWLKRNRARLVATMVEKYAPKRALEMLEVGAGMGQNVPALARLGAVDVEEVNEGALAHLRQLSGVRAVFTDPIPFQPKRDYDVVCALDVVEHLAEDRAALDWLTGLLRPGGLAIITVPAYQWLFSDHDVALGHFRRYTKRSLLDAFPDGGRLKILQAGYFNALLFPAAIVSRAAWLIGRRLRGDGGSTKQPSTQNRLVDQFLGGVLAAEVGLARAGLRMPFGLSVYAVAQRSTSDGR